MSNKDHRFTFAIVELKQFLLQHLAGLGIHRSERLVHQENLWVNRQGARQAHALLHAARELVRVFEVPSGELHRLDSLPGNLTALVFSDASHLQSERYVVPDVAVGHQGHVLENHADGFGADLTQFLRAHGTDVSALDINRTVGRLNQSVDVSDQSRLP